MATAIALAKQREAATGRIAAQLQTLKEQFGLRVDTAALSGRGKDADIAHTRQMEAFADVLEQVVASLSPQSTPEGASVLVVDGIDTKHLDALAGAGLTSLDDLRNASDEELLAVDSIGPATVKKIRQSLQELPDGGNTSER